MKLSSICNLRIYIEEWRKRAIEDCVLPAKAFIFTVGVASGLFCIVSHICTCDFRDRGEKTTVRGKTTVTVLKVDSLDGGEGVTRIFHVLDDET